MNLLLELEISMSEPQSPADAGMRDLVKGSGLSLVAAASLVIVLVGGVWTVAGELRSRDIAMTVVNARIETLETSERIFSVQLQKLEAGLDQRLASERGFAASHRVRLFDRLQAVEGREVARQQDIALIKDRVERMSIQLDRLIESLFPKVRRQAP